MGCWLEEQLKALGVTTIRRDLGQQTLQGQRLDLPPAILGRLGDDPKKKTVLIYGHYDVQPVSVISASVERDDMLSVMASIVTRRCNRTDGRRIRLRLSRRTVSCMVVGRRTTRDLSWAG